MAMNGGICACLGTCSSLSYNIVIIFLVFDDNQNRHKASKEIGQSTSELLTLEYRQNNIFDFDRSIACLVLDIFFMKSADIQDRH